MLTLYVELNSHHGSEHGEARFRQHQDDGTEQEEVTCSTNDHTEKDVSILFR